MNPNIQDQKRKDGIKFIRTFALLFFGIIIVILWLSGGVSLLLAKFTVAPGLTTYLNDKYDQEFVVKDVRITGSGLGVPGMYRAQANPVNDPTLTFEVGKSRSNNSHFDGYPGAVWEREERPRVASFLKTVYGPTSVPDFDLTTHIPTPAAPDPIRGEVPNIDKALDRYRDNFLYSVTIQLATPSELSEDEIIAHTDKMREVIDYVLSKEVSSPSVRYAINIDGQEKSYLCNLYKGELTDQAAIESCIKLKHGKSW